MNAVPFLRRQQIDDMKTKSGGFFFLVFIKSDEEESQALLKRLLSISLSLNFFWKLKQTDLGSQRSLLLLPLFENNFRGTSGCVLGLNTRSSAGSVRPEDLLLYTSSPFTPTNSSVHFHVLFIDCILSTV